MFLATTSLMVPCIAVMFQLLVVARHTELSEQNNGQCDPIRAHLGRGWNENYFGLVVILAPMMKLFGTVIDFVRVCVCVCFR